MPRRVPGPRRARARPASAKGVPSVRPTALAAPQRKRLRRVLIATDFSRSAKAALERAALLPLNPKASIGLLHVLPEATRIGGREATRAQGRLEEAHRGLLRWLRQAQLPGVRVHPDTACGPPFLEIIRRARGMKAELIVVGRRGRGIARLSLGSTAERVVRKAGIPVLVVGPPPRAPYRLPLLALEAAPESRAIAEMAGRLLPPSATAITVLHAYEVPFEGYAAIGGASEGSIRRGRKAAAERAKAALAESAKTLAESGVEPKVMLRHGDPRLVILETLHRLRSDLVAVGTHGRTGITHFLLGSVAQEVVRSAKSDVLVVRTAGVVVLPPR